ncbi:uncharacterized protein LOC132927583 [Rhopalosiphum padi]|uniref:uncharacterized protein LOC132927583 n=1 Tax=Rhopalosiphum padi TaxID=40932 RepID=UPI00298DAF34|nr:uncharacterized protein LOC132927583 [Rhopalosiphum padi]
MVNYTLMSVFLLSFYFIGLGSAETEFEKIYTECVDDMKNEHLMYYDPDRNSNENASNLSGFISSAVTNYCSGYLTSGYAYEFIKNYRNDNLFARYKYPSSFCVALKSYRQPYKHVSEITRLPTETLSNIRVECLCDMVSHGLATHVNTECVGNMDSHGLATDDASHSSYSDVDNLNAAFERIYNSARTLNKGYAFTFINSYNGNILKDDFKGPTSFCNALSNQVDPFTDTDST